MLKRPRYFLNNWGWWWNLGLFWRSNCWIFEIVKHYGTPQNTGSHPCTRSGWSCSLSERSRSLYNWLSNLAISQAPIFVITQPNNCLIKMLRRFELTIFQQQVLGFIGESPPMPSLPTIRKPWRISVCNCLGNEVCQGKFYTGTT